MSKKKETTKGIENVEQTLTKTEQFLEENYKPLLYGLVILVVIVGIFWLARFYIGKQNKEAASQIFIAEQYLGQDSLKLALYGTGDNPGFIDIADSYKMTKTGKLANYYAGLCLTRLGEFEQALDYLPKYTIKDDLIAPQARGLMGDANLELGNAEKAVKLYIEAAEMADNSFHSPIYLMKAGEEYQRLEKYNEALEIYERIKAEFPESNEGRNIDKYIAIVSMHLN